MAVVEAMTRDRRRGLVAGGAERGGHRVQRQVAGRLAVAALQWGHKSTRGFRSSAASPTDCTAPAAAGGGRGHVQVGGGCHLTDRRFGTLRVGGEGQARAARLNLQQLAFGLRVVAAAGRMGMLLLLRGLLHVAGRAGCGRGLEFFDYLAGLGAAKVTNRKGKHYEVTRLRNNHWIWFLVF